MSKYTLITAKLKIVNEARFQLICNNYLAREYNGDLKSPGTVVGKEKTRKGKPDAYIRFDDGSYLLGEYTTKEKDDSTDAFFKKLENDLRDCLNANALGIKQEQIRQIVLCTNSAVVPEEEEVLHAIAAPHKLRIVDVQTLSIFLYSKGKTIAKEFLDVPFDTNQLLTKKEFLEQYHKKNLSTRLDTVLVARELEQAEIKKAIEDKGLTIIKGPAGVGKSRLVLEAIDTFVDENPKFETFYIQSKNDSITDDLAYNLEADGSYLLFIDDANRQMDNFLRIIYKQIEPGPGNIKVILTVRDYAFEDIRRRVGEIDFGVIEVRRLGDEIIRSILLKNEYVIKDAVLLNRIVSISQGNPRLAIMAALSVEKADFNVLVDVSTIYDAYFQTIIHDKEVFKEPTTLKVLGILSYFYAMDLETVNAKEILQNFNIAYDTFIETVNLLHDLELVDIYQSYTVKITEQVLATYFFYKVFIRERLLSFELLLQTSFYTSTYRMKDSFYSAVNSFGVANTVTPLKDVLLRFYETSKNDDRNEDLFLQVFAPYLPLQVFAAVQKNIAGLTPYKESSDAKHSTFTSLQFHTPLQFLEKFYGSKDAFELLTALELTIQFVAKKPFLYEVTQKSILDRLRTTEEDFPACERQRIAFEWLRQQNDGLSKKYFFSIFSHVFLNAYFPEEAYYKNGEHWDLHGSLKELRGSFWQAMRDSIQEDRDVCFSVLWEYLHDMSRRNAILLPMDSPYLKFIIDEEFDVSSFEDALFVHRYLKLIKEQGLHLSWYRKTKLRFTNKPYQIFLALSFEREERLSLHERYSDYEKYNAYQLSKIAKALPVKKLAAFKEIYPALQEINQLSRASSLQVHPEIDLFIAGIIASNPAEGLKVLRYYFQQKKLRPLNPVVIYKQALTAGVEWVHKIYQLTKRLNFSQQEDWQEFYFAILPEQDCTNAKLKQLLSLYQSASVSIRWKNIVLSKYIAVEPNLPIILLRLLTAKRNTDPMFKYDLGYEFFLQYPEVLEQDLKVSKEAYFQHLKMEGDHDYDKKEFALFFKKDPRFLIEYINHKQEISESLSDNSFSGMQKIWEMGDPAPAIYEALLFLINLKTYYGSDHLGLIFFHHLQEPYISEAITLLKKLVNDFHADKRVINTVLDIARNAFPKHYHELIAYYLSRNPDFELFKKIHLYNNHFMSSGNVSWDEFKANVLRGISGTIQHMSRAYLYTEHLAFLDRCIVGYIRNAEEERKQWFMGRS